MIFENHKELVERIHRFTNRKVYSKVKIFEDTTSYMAIYGGTVLRLEGNDYFVMGDTKEGRFGIDNQPKFWVKYAVDLTTGENKIIKLVFHEQFSTTVGPVTVRCKRNPEKESAFLELVRGNPRFMQGVTVRDPVGNAVRIIDFIKGDSFYNYIASLEMPHEQYYHEVLPGVLEKLVSCVEAMAGVHRHGQHHGDIRNDHIFVERNSGEYVWIDFDYEVNFTDYDIWSMGNILIYAVGMGIHAFHDIQKHPERYPLKQSFLDEHDAMVFYTYRVANLRKLFPYISRRINSIMMRFSEGAFDFYEDLETQVEDIKAVL